MLEAFKKSLQEAYEKEKDDLKEFLEQTNESNMDIETLEKIRDYVIAIPDAIADLNALVLDPRAPGEVKVFFGALMSYLLNPHDLLPEDQYGFFGYLDDAYITHKSLELAIGKLSPELKAELITDTAAFEPVFSTTKMIRDYLPVGVLNRLDRLLDMFKYSANVMFMSPVLSKMEGDMSKQL